MEKVIRIVKKGQDDANIRYWASLSYDERLEELERLRQAHIKAVYGENRPRFQRVYRVIKRERR